MADQDKKETDFWEKERQWAEKKLIRLDETEDYDEDLSSLTGSAFQNDFDKIKKLDNYQQAKVIETLFSNNEKQGRINQFLGIEPYYGLLFAGPSGCGKMTTAVHLVGNLKKDGYCYLVRLTGNQFGNLSLQKAVGRMRGILDFASDEHALVLIVDQLSKNKFAEELYEILLDFTEEQVTDCFFPILLEEDAAAFSSELRRNFPLISFPLPSLEERINYVRLHQKVEVWLEEEEDSEEDYFSYKIIFDGITLEEIGAETEGFSYLQLEYLMVFIKLHMGNIIAQEKKSDKSIKKCIQREGYYKVKGHLVRSAIRMSGQAADRFAPTEGLKQLQESIRNISQRVGGTFDPQQPQSDKNDTDNQKLKYSLSELEQKVMTAAEGGEKDYAALIERYKNPVHKKDEFGQVDERLANGPDEYDAEE